MSIKAEISNLENQVAKVIATNGAKRYIFSVELGVIINAWGGGLKWTNGAKFKSVWNKLSKRGFEIERIQVLTQY